MENKITLEQLTDFIRTKTDLTIENFCYNICSINIGQTLILSANYDCQSFNAICDNNAESLLNLIVKIFIGNFNSTEDSHEVLSKYLLGEESETYNPLFTLADELNKLHFWQFQELSVDELKEKIVEAILKDLNS